MRSELFSATVRSQILLFATVQRPKFLMRLREIRNHSLVLKKIAAQVNRDNTP